MKQPRTFLTAEWINLVMLNYVVDPSLLQPLVPFGTELDQHDGKTYASLIGFEFNNTRVFGVSIPFHRSFEEVNLRFYIRRGSRRGVVFVSELVPKLAITAIARFAFGEKYSCVPMSHRVQSRANDDVVEAEFSWGVGASRCTLQLETKGAGFLPAEASHSQFITEHYWGYAAKRNGGSLEYEVQHPQWKVREAKIAEFRGDGTRLYGAALGKAILRPPDSAFLAEGSPVTVFKGTRLR